jgi:K+-transporting ATPase ATPase C chain
MKLIRPTLVSLLLFSLLFGGAYPLFATSMGNALFTHGTQGSILRDQRGRPLGSELIGQNFSEPQYFWGRLSATAPTPYNAAASTGSNYGPLNSSLHDAVQGRIDALHAADPGNSQRVPADLATASGSGLDPHISLAAAQYQLPRVARARGLSAGQVQKLLDRYTEGRQFGVLGEPRVNVLKLNLALDGRF